MSNGHDQWVCLRCFNRWTPRSEPSEQMQCSNIDCRSQRTVRLNTLKKNAEAIDRGIRSLPVPIGEFLTLPNPTGNLPTLLRSSRDILTEADAQALDGIELYGAVLQLVENWDPDEEPLTAAIDRLNDYDSLSDVADRRPEYSIEFDDGSRIVHSQQAELMRLAINHLIADYDLSEKIEIPYIFDGTRLIIDKPKQSDDLVMDAPAELINGYVVETELPKESKRCVLENLAEKCDVEVVFGTEWR